MTPAEAIHVLLTEYDLLDCLEQWEDVVREKVRDDGFEGLTSDSPKVQRYQAICQRIKAGQRTEE